MLVRHNRQQYSHVNTSNNENNQRQQVHMPTQVNQSMQTDSTRQTLELLEYVMPQNRRIYNFGVKTLQTRPIGKQSSSIDDVNKVCSSRSM
jgi:hypothetical protein